MRKKEFWIGIVIGIALPLCGMFVWRTALAMGIVPWQYIHVGEDLSVDEKTQMIESYLENYYVDGIDTEAVEEGAYTGMVSAVGDKYTYYMSAEELEDYLENTSGDFQGIGIYFTMDADGRPIVVSIIEGTPAEEAGMLPGDELVKINGQSVAGMNMNEISNLIKGEEGTTEEITIYRDSTGETLTLEVERRKIDVITVESLMLDHQIGYIRIASFKSNTYDQFKEALTSLEEQGMKGLILDLRDNGGGLVDIACAIGDELLPAGTMVYTIDQKENREDHVCDDEYLDIPLAVLVNGNSASSSEILSGAILDEGAGTLVGTQTFGKGLVQGLFQLPDGSAMSITIQKYYTPSGVCIHGTGITPNIVVDLPEGKNLYNITMEEDTQLAAAIDVIQEELNR